MTPIWSQVMKDSGLSLDELTLAIRDVWYVSRLFDNILKGMGSAMTADDAARRDQSGMNVIHASGTMLLFFMDCKIPARRRPRRAYNRCQRKDQALDRRIKTKDQINGAHFTTIATHQNGPHNARHTQLNNSCETHSHTQQAHGRGHNASTATQKTSNDEATVHESRLPKSPVVWSASTVPFKDKDCAAIQGNGP